jgi:signal peptidase I
MQTQYLVLLTLYLLTSVGLFKIFEKAGEKGWKGLIPGLNLFIWLKVIQRPWWWLLLLIVPGVNFLMLAIMSVELAKAFGKTNNTELVIAALFGFVYIPYIGFQQELKYVGVHREKHPKSALREWTDAIIFAVIAATIIRTFFLEAFTIPTSSLEKSLMVGDYLFVSKMSYGAKIPNTPLSFPFAHHTLPFTESVKSYLEWIKLPYFRLPALGKVKNNDYVVFNYPDGDTVALKMQNQSYYQLCRDVALKFNMNIGKAREYIWEHPETFGEIIARPPDKRENYIKRCIGTPGDTLFIKNKTVYVNGKTSYIAGTMQHNFIVKTRDGLGLSNKVLEKFDITDPIDYESIPGASIVTLPNNRIEEFKKLSVIDTVVPLVTDSNYYDYRTFPHNPHYKWNVDNFGPLLMPKKGATVQLDTNNISLYDRIIQVYENNKLEIKNGKIFINGQETNTYTFKLDYYFMMGDNRHNSADSRCWGFVPEDHIVGKAVFIWMSLKDQEHNGDSGKLRLSRLFKEDSKFRWNRFFTFVSSDGLSRSYLIHFIVIVAGISGFNYFRRKRKAKTETKK